MPNWVCNSVRYGQDDYGDTFNIYRWDGAQHRYVYIDHDDD